MIFWMCFLGCEVGAQLLFYLFQISQFDNMKDAFSMQIQDRQYVLNFLSKVQQEHEQQINKIEKTIEKLESDKKQVETQLLQTKELYEKQGQQLKQLMKQRQCLIKRIEENMNTNEKKRVEKVASVQHIKKQDEFQNMKQNIENIIKKSNIVPNTAYNVKPDQTEKCKGDLLCLIWGKDKYSLEKYQHVSCSFINALMKKKEQIIETLLITSMKQLIK